MHGYQMLLTTNFSIKQMLLLIIFLITVPAAGIIVYSGVTFRNNILAESHNELFMVVERFASEQQNIAASTEQLLATLSQVDYYDDNAGNHSNKLLKELITQFRRSSKTSNIFVLDKDGYPQSSATQTALIRKQTGTFNKRYFQSAVSQKQFSSGEYLFSANPIPENYSNAFHFALPVKNRNGDVNKIMVMAFDINMYSSMIKNAQLKTGVNLVALDHDGLIMATATDSERQIGKAYPSEEFKKIQHWPDNGITEIGSDSRGKRIIAYRKLWLKGEHEPYMYVIAEVPEDIVTNFANLALLKSISALASSLVFACLCAIMLAKHSIINRFTRFGEAAQNLAKGDFSFRIKNIGAGEMGQLGATFNIMAEELERRESERLIAAAENRFLTKQLIQAQKMESIGRLAGEVAHNFNNMLTPIIGYADMLQADLSAADEKSKAAIILSAAMKGKKLVQQLLSFSGKPDPDLEKIELNEVIKVFQNILRYTVREEIEIKLALADGKYSILADSSQIEQVIANLAINAQDAISGSGVIRIETTPLMIDENSLNQYPEIIPGKYIVMAVSDNGRGMCQEEQNQIFEPFFTTKGVGKGTGLGLVMVYGVVTQHGGNIAVCSKVGYGTTFKCYFPLVDDSLYSFQPLQSVSQTGRTITDPELQLILY